MFTSAHLYNTCPCIDTVLVGADRRSRAALHLTAKAAINTADLPVNR